SSTTVEGPELPIPWRDPMSRLPRKFSPWVWVLAVLLFAVIYCFMYSVVHVYVDRRSCLTTLPNAPFFKLIDRDLGWYLVSRLWFEWITVGAALVLIV